MQHPDDGLIEEYLDGELASPERTELEAHLAGCAACRERVETQRRFLAEASLLIEDLGDLVPMVPVPEEYLASAVGPAPDRLPSRPSALPPYRRLAWAATLVIAAGVGYASGTWRAQLLPAPQAAQQAESSQVRHPVNEQSANSFARQSAEGPPTA